MKCLHLRKRPFQAEVEVVTLILFTRDIISRPSRQPVVGQWN
jgi:hypothetical protein